MTTTPRKAHEARKAWSILAAVGSANALVASLHFGLGAAAPPLRSGLGVGEATLGIILAAIPLGLMLGTFAWGVIADRIGERRTLTLAIALTTLASAGSAIFAHQLWNQPPDRFSLTVFVLLLGVLGLGGSAAHSAGGRAIVEAFPERVHGRVLAIRHTLIPVGGTIGALTIPWLLLAYGLAETMLVSAGLGAIIALLIYLRLPSGRLTRAAHQKRNSEKISDNQATNSPLKRPELWLLGGSGALLALVQLTLASFLTLHLVDVAGFSIAAAASIFAAAQLSGAVIRILMGDLADRSGDAGGVLMRIAIAAALLLLLALIAPPKYEGLLLAICLLLTTSWNGVAVAAAASLAPTGRMGATLGMQTTLNATMGVLAPIGAGILLATTGWNAIIMIALAAVVSASIGFSRVRPHVKRDPSFRIRT